MFGILVGTTFGTILGSILDPFWDLFGLIFGTFLGSIFVLFFLILLTRASLRTYVCKFIQMRAGTRKNARKYIHISRANARTYAQIRADTRK